MQAAQEFGFHPEACTPGAGNQKGSVEALVKWVKGNFLSGRGFADDADLAEQSQQWCEAVNARPSSATGLPPAERLAQEACKGGPLPGTAADDGFLQAGRVGTESLVAVLGNQYSVPIVQLGAPVTVRVHQDRIVLWRDTTLVAAHRRAPDGAHERVVIPEHFAPLFGRKPRAQVMLYRAALLELGPVAQRYGSELSRRQRTRLRDEILAVAALVERHGGAEVVAAMELADRVIGYGAAYLEALLTEPASTAHALLTAFPVLALPGVPAQDAIDRQLSMYEAYVQGAATPVERAEVPA